MTFLQRHKPNAIYVPTGERVHVMEGSTAITPTHPNAVLFGDGKLRPVRNRDLKMDAVKA